MKTLALLLIVANFGHSYAQYFLNCDLKTGFGCWSAYPYFDMRYTGETPGHSSECRRNYKLEITLQGRARGFFCYFITENIDPHGFVYTMSHNNRDYDNSDTPHIRQFGQNTRFVPQDRFSQNPYNRNFWYYNDFHHPRRSSWAFYKIKNDKLTTYSENLDSFYKAGHPNMFEPRNRHTYVGLNRNYDNTLSQGKGLCQIYCEVVGNFGSGGGFGTQGSPGAPGSLAAAENSLARGETPLASTDVGSDDFNGKPPAPPLPGVGVSAQDPNGGSKPAGTPPPPPDPTTTRRIPAPFPSPPGRRFPFPSPTTTTRRTPVPFPSPSGRRFPFPNPPGGSIRGPRFPG